MFSRHLLLEYANQLFKAINKFLTKKYFLYLSESIGHINKTNRTVKMIKYMINMS